MSNEQTNGAKILVSNDSWNCGIKLLPWDSEHFGIPMGDLDLQVTPGLSRAPDVLETGLKVIKQCLQEAKSQGIKHLQSVTDPASTAIQYCLQKSSFLLMDTLVTYELTMLKNQHYDTNFSIRPATSSDINALSDISETCFCNSTYNINRFNSDPWLDQALVKKMYRLMGERSVTGVLADQVLVFEQDNAPVGFITIKLPLKNDRIAHILLNAVHPEYHNQGIYTYLVKAAINWLQEHNISSVDIKTQLPGMGVHRTWLKLGACLTAFQHRFHCWIQ